MASFATPTIVRIKRRLDAESSESIIISSKKKRLNDAADGDPVPLVTDMVTTILKKLTTLKNEDCIEIEAKKALEKEPNHSWLLRKNYKKGCRSTAKELVTKKSHTDLTAIRFKLICSKRSMDKDESTSDASFHMLDALKEKEENSSALLPCSSKNTDTDIIICNGVPMESEQIQYVYDLYYTSIPLELSSWINNICEIQKCNAALDYRDNTKGDTDSGEDEDDENDESNWRNEYPDEEEGEFYEDEDDFLCAQMKKNKLYKSDESFDADEYNDDGEGDFDEDGNQVLLYNYDPRTVFGKPKVNCEDDSSSSDGDKGD